MPHRTTALLWRAFLAAALVCAVGLLPWLSRTDPALTVLKARSAERDPDPEVLAAVRAQLGLEKGPLHLLGQWLGGLPRGDAGRSWISGAEVMPGVLQALGASLLLMGAAAAVAVVTAAAVCARTLRRGALAMERSDGGGPGLPGVLREFGARWLGGSGPVVGAARPESLARRWSGRPRSEPTQAGPPFLRPRRSPATGGAPVVPRGGPAAPAPPFSPRCPSSSPRPCSPPSSGYNSGGCPRWGGTGRDGRCCPRSRWGCPPGRCSGGCSTTCCRGRSVSRGRGPPPRAGCPGGGSPGMRCDGVCPGCCPTWACSWSV